VTHPLRSTEITSVSSLPRGVLIDLQEVPMLAHLHVNVLPHTARRRRAIKHFCCKSAHIKLNLPEQLRTTRCGPATPDSVRNLLLPRCRPPLFVPPGCRFAFGWGGVKDHARPAGSKKHRCFAVQSNTSRIGSPVCRYRCLSLLSSAPPAAPNVVHEDAARWKKMP
jgi:hypothetical protein